MLIQDMQTHAASHFLVFAHVDPSYVLPQRRCVVDSLGWEPFQDWFYQQGFRGWWQVDHLIILSPS